MLCSFQSANALRQRSLTFVRATLLKVLIWGYALFFESLK